MLETVRQVAKQLRIAPERIRAAIRAGELPGYKHGLRWVRVDPPQGWGLGYSSLLDRSNVIGRHHFPACFAYRPLTQALDDPRDRAVVASLGLGAELNIRDPQNLDSEPTAPPLDYSSGVYFGALPVGMELGVALGLPLGDHLAVRANADAWLMARDDSSVQYSLLGGLRVLPWEFGRDKFAYAEAQIGPSIVTHENQSSDQQLSLDLELGARLGGCQSGIDWGMRFRSRVEGGFHLQAAVMVLRVEYEERRKWRTNSRCERPAPPRRPLPAAPWVPTPRVPGPHELEPAPVEPTPKPHEPEPIPVEPIPEPRPSGQVEVEVVIKPVVVEVTLGTVFLGGALEVSIDPRLIPLRRLRTGAWIEVEISGPASALARYQAQLSATLSRNRLAVNAWTRAATGSRTVRAKFTIWPKRPPGR